MTILDELKEHAIERVSAAKKKIPLTELKRLAEQEKKGGFEFEDAIRAKSKDTGDIAFICECKKASPSKGIIDSEFKYLDIAREYEAAGADCISVLTEPKWFLGDDRYLKEIAEAVSLPCLRKDFTVDEYMIYEAKLLNARAVLLIVSILEEKKLKEYLDICGSLGLSALVEIHDEKEAETALKANARIIGVNNRDLKSFNVDTKNSLRLRDMIPEDVIFVSESGVKTAEDIKALKEAGADAVLIGETMMRASDKKEMLKELKSLL